MWLGDLLLYHAGAPQPFDAAAASAYMKREPTFTCVSASRWEPADARSGPAITHQYIRLNAEYTT